MLTLFALCACASSDFEEPTFSRSQAEALLRDFVLAEGRPARLALSAARVRALVGPALAPGDGDRAAAPEARVLTESLSIVEHLREKRRVRYRVAVTELRGAERKDTLRYLTLVQEEGLPRVLWLAPLVEEAWAVYQAGGLSEARARFDELMDLDPTSSLLADRAGWVAYRGGRLEAAERLFQRAMALAPDQATPIASLAGVRYRQGRGDEAVALYQRALALEETVESLVNLGFVHKSLGQLPDAESAWRRALALDGGHPAVLLSLAELQEQREDYLGCEELSRRAWTNRDKLEKTIRNRLAATRAVCLYMTKNEQAAEQVYRALLASSPRSSSLARLTARLRGQGAAFVGPGAKPKARPPSAGAASHDPPQPHTQPK